MSKTSKSSVASKSVSSPTEQYVRVRLRALEIPPIKDGIVIGKSAPMGVEAMLRTLKLMSNERFVHVEVKDGGAHCDAIVRESVVKKLKQEKLANFILQRICPFMADNEILMLDMEIEVVVEDTI
ncbi:MAG TPA: hypothetical protein VFT72_17465 [Opitutaceae bacterium]|nr:hypothetical protein [Opitutaceae bacterium]